MSKMRLVTILGLCSVCLGAGCPACNKSGAVPLLDLVEDKPRASGVRIDDELAQTVQSAFFEFVPAGALSGLMKKSAARGERFVDVFAEKVDAALLRAASFLHELCDAADARDCSPGELLVYMAMRGELPPVVTPPPSPAAPGGKVIPFSRRAETPVLRHHPDAHAAPCGKGWN